MSMRCVPAYDCFSGESPPFHADHSMDQYPLIRYNFRASFSTRCNRILMKYSGKLAPEDFVNRALRQGDNKQVAIRPGFDIGDHAKVSTDEQAFTFCDLMFGKVVCHPVLQPRVIYTDLPPIPGQIEMEQIASLQERRGCPHKQVILELRSQASAVDEIYAAWRHFPFPTEGGVAVLSARKHEQA